MSDIDLTEAYDAAHRANCDVPGCNATLEAEAAVDAALPYIREQIAREIAAESAKQKRWADEAAEARGGVRSSHDDGYRLGLDAAARIVQGES